MRPAKKAPSNDVLCDPAGLARDSHVYYPLPTTLIYLKVVSRARPNLIFRVTAITAR
jgi:hypothetical protein